MGETRTAVTTSKVIQANLTRFSGGNDRSLSVEWNCTGGRWLGTGWRGPACPSLCLTVVFDWRVGGVGLQAAVKNQQIIEAIGKMGREELAALALAIQARIDELERDKGELYLTLHKGEWYATMPPQPDGRRRVITKLGPKLSPAAALKQAREKPPEMEAFELPKSDAARIKTNQPDRVGWWEDGRGNRRYYDRPAHDQARSLWRKGHDLANHPLAIALGLTCRGVEKLVKLEADGYRLVLPES